MFQDPIRNTMLHLVVLSPKGEGSGLWQFLSFSFLLLFSLTWHLVQVFYRIPGLSDVFSRLDRVYRFWGRLSQRWSTLFLSPYQGTCYQLGLSLTVLTSIWLRKCFPAFSTMKLLSPPFHILCKQVTKCWPHSRRVEGGMGIKLQFC